jgi:hypothetical protein
MCGFSSSSHVLLGLDYKEEERSSEEDTYKIVGKQKHKLRQAKYF